MILRTNLKSSIKSLRKSLESSLKSLILRTNLKSSELNSWTQVSTLLRTSRESSLKSSQVMSRSCSPWEPVLNHASLKSLSSRTVSKSQVFENKSWIKSQIFDLEIKSWSLEYFRTSFVLRLKWLILTSFMFQVKSQISLRKQILN